MKTRSLYGLVLICWSLSLVAQKAASAKPENDVDPLALQVVKVVTDPLRQAKTYSFRALVSHEYVGTDGQIITLFHVSDVTVEKPDKLHVNFRRGSGQEVQLFFNAGQATLYSPAEHLYTVVSTPQTIDAALDALEKKDIYIPIRNFLASDPYHSLTADLRTGYVVGRETVFDQDVHHLAFTEADAEWQLWVTGGEKPRIVRLQVVDDSKPEHPRTTVQFLDWDFSPAASASLFMFEKPADAKQIEVLEGEATK